MKSPAPLPDEDFSLVLGGPLYQTYLRARLLRPQVELVERRVAACIVLTWLPLLVLAVAAGNAVGGPKMPFLFDLEVHVRLLLALPLLIGTEVVVHRFLSVTVREFVARGMVVPEDRARFDAIIATTMRWRNSAAVEIALLALSASLGYWIWRRGVSLHVGTWYYATGATGEHLTAAGGWYAFVSLNLFRFILFRWYFRLTLWYALLWRVSRLPLRLAALHPDRAGGLGFLALSLIAVAPILLAHTATISGAIANHIWHEGANLPSFQQEILGVIVLLMAIALLPLMFFSGALVRAKREGQLAYGALAMEYVETFRAKWLGGKRPEEPLVGSADIQSLADLGNAFEVVRGMRPIPFDLQVTVGLAIAISLPFAPLVLMMFPVDELIAHLVTRIL